MYNYYKQLCPVCGKQFEEGDDIVVCPDCGTPYHRACYASVGKCVYTEKHKDGFEWKPVIIAGVNDTEETVKCPYCGADCRKDAQYCEKCGHPLNENHSAHNDKDFETFREDYRQKVQDELNTEMDGFRLGDYAAYIGTNAQYYVFKFRRMLENPKYKPFNWAAFLFAPVWFIFRKLYLWGIASAAVNFLFNIPSMIIMASETGRIAADSPLMFSGISDVAFYMSFAEIAVNLIWGFIAIPLYRKSITKKLTQIKEKVSGDSDRFYQEVMRQAGPSKIGIALCALTAVVYLISFLS